MRFKFRKTNPYYFILFFLFVTAIIMVGLYYYNYVLEREKHEAYDNLSVLAKVKINEIVGWRNERLGEAKFIQNNVQFNSMAFEFIKHPQSLKKDVVDWLKPIKENHEYTNICIIDTSGEFYSLFKNNDSLSSPDKSLINQCIEKKEIILAGIYKNPDTNEITMGCFIPLTIQNKSNGNVFGVLTLRIDPQKNLYPLIEITPVAFKSAESFLVVQDGDRIIFLNELKFRKNSALTFKLPLSTENLSAAMVVKGKRGIYEGVDYNGKEVLADLGKIPDSDWFIVSKINLDEIYAPIKEQTIYILGGVLLLILLSGSTVFIAWKNEKIKFINRELKSESEKKDLFKNMAEGYVYCHVILNKNGPDDLTLLEINEAFKKLTGLNNVVGKNLSEIIPDIKRTNPEVLNICERVALTGSPETFEIYIEVLGKWFRVSIYSPEKEYFVAVFNDITEQKKTILELRKLSSAVEQSPASVVITNLKGNIEYVNPKFTEVTGYSFEEIVGKNPRILKSGKTPKYIYTTLWETITNGNEWTGEFSNKKKNGEMYWEYASISPIKNESGITTHYVAVKENITKQKQIEEDLKSSEERFRKMFENHKAVMLIMDPDTGSIVDANPAAINFYGYSHKVLCSMTIQNINQLPPDEIELERQKALNKEQGYFIFPHKLADGQVRTVEVYSSPLKIKRKPLLFSIIHDITDRKKAEEALRESEKRFRNLADSMPQLVWTANPDGIVDYYNNRVSEFEGITLNKDGSWVWAPVLHDDDIRPTIDAWNNSINTGNNYEIIHRVKKMDGIFRWFLSRAYPIKNSKDKIIKWYGTATDVNEQMETKKALELALLELKRSNKELEQFAYTASHDLQEPIRMIRSYAQILEMKNKENLTDNAKEHLDFIAEGALRMQQLVDDLLKYSRVSTNKKEFEQVDCNLVLKDVMEDLKFRIQEENVFIDIDKLPVIKGDRTQLRQLFQNFIQNAIKFRSDRNPEIQIKSERMNGNWLFSISDNGIGIDSRFYERIFVTFQRLHEREKYPGTGIGLAICKKIIERHGGQVFVKSELNKGSTFYFTIPI